ncbi:50S ribosomal protein L37ae [Candidatus Micrarchaeota archaeon]|nr:MAG: 50S ribosomal protein L37ae [Candidatus Micrarchaeota archaeon]
MVNRDVRSGSELRKRADSADKLKRASYPCPVCGKRAVRRISNAKWKCRSCKKVFAGGAYSLTTPMGQIGTKALDDMRARKKE